ncbi:MAG: hypothetical protein FAZ92_02728 [Accumulibacter sp.]|nr:MAG: hypothetical protein FAZ92_02728 [Accumulibacter sp.]
MPELPAVSVKELATVTTLLASSIVAVGVKVAVQVTLSEVANAPSVPFSTVTSALVKSATASLKTIVTVAVSPIFSAESLIDIDETFGPVWSST